MHSLPHGPTTATVVTPVTVYYDDLGNSTLGYTRVLNPAPRLVVVNKALQGDPREQGVIDTLVSWKPSPARCLAELMFPSPMVLKGRIRPSLLQRLIEKVK